MDLQSDEQIKAMLTIYCPICQRNIVATNINEVAEGIAEGFVYIHDDVYHSEDDLVAIDMGIQ